MVPSGSIEVVYTGTRAPEEAPEGIELRHAPLLQVSFAAIDPAQLERMLERRSALVVFSKNAVRSLRRESIRNALEPTDRHEWWAVGAKTAEFAERTFGVRVRHPEQQNFEGLFETFASASLPDRVVVFTLEGKARDLSPVLEPRGIEVHEIPAYRTEPVSYPSPAELVGDGDWVVLTSPKGVEALLATAETIDDVREALDRVQIATIGPKTADAARSRGLHVDLVAPEPDRRVLLEAIADSASSTDSER